MKAQARLLPGQADPRSADSIYRAGVAAAKHGRAEEALALAEAGIGAYPGDSRMWQIMGLAYRKLEETALAIDAFTAAARLAPSDALIAHSLARVTLEAGLPATSLFERALRLAPTDASILLGRAAAQYGEGRIDAAIIELDQLLDRHPGWAEGHATAARLYWMGGERDRFTSSLERALRKTPRDIDLWRTLINARLSAEQFEQMLAAIAQARIAAGESREFDALEAACLTECGETARAELVFGRLERPLAITTLVSYLRHLLRSGRPAEAAAAAEARIADDPDDLLRPYLASAWRLLGDPRWQWLEGDPRFVGIYDIGGKVGPLDALAERLRGLHQAVQQPLDQTLRRGTQTDGPLFARIEPEIRALRKAIVETVETHIAQLPAHDQGHPLLREPRAPIRFSGSWSVRLTDAGYHINHIHSAGWISSAFYVALPEAHMGGAAHAGWLSLGEVTELGLDLPPLRLIEPKPGRLVLFPSTMWHGTRPFPVGERLTVAFDVARPSR